jgi:hypothetical protein
MLIAVGTSVARCHRAAGVVARPRLPQNVACSFTHYYALQKLIHSVVARACSAP